MRMTKILSLLLLFWVITGFNLVSNVETKVFICKGKSSKRYHYDKHCRGLSNCSTKTFQVSLSEAKDLGRTLCGWED